MRHCNGCNQDLPDGDFYRRPDGYPRGRCKACHRDDMNRRRTPEVLRRQKLRLRYGMTPEQWDRMAARQKGQCRICKTDPDRGLVVDHCHVSGKVRGLLCHKCNKALGLLGDRFETVAAAAAYLRHFLDGGLEHAG